jgi:hypothetical protein
VQGNTKVLWVQEMRERERRMLGRDKEKEGNKRG